MDRSSGDSNQRETGQNTDQSTQVANTQVRQQSVNQSIENGQNTDQSTQVADTQVRQQSVNQSIAVTDHKIDNFQQSAIDQVSDTDSQASDESFTVIDKDDCDDNNDLNKVSLNITLTSFDQGTRKDDDNLKSHESKGGHELQTEIKVDHSRTQNEIRQDDSSGLRQSKNSEESTMSDKTTRCLVQKNQHNSEDLNICPESLEKEAAQNSLKSNFDDSSKHAGTEGTETIYSREAKTNFDSEENKPSFSHTNKTTEHHTKNRREASENKPASAVNDFNESDSADTSNASKEHVETKDRLKEMSAKTSGQQCNNGFTVHEVKDVQKKGEYKLTLMGKREDKELQNATENVLEKQSMATVLSTQKPNRNFTEDEKLLHVLQTSVEDNKDESKEATSNFIEIVEKGDSKPLGIGNAQPIAGKVITTSNPNTENTTKNGKSLQVSGHFVDEVKDEQKKAKNGLTEILKTEGKEPSETSNVQPVAEKVLEKQSMGTVSPTSKPNSENPKKYDKLSEVSKSFVDEIKDEQKKVKFGLTEMVTTEGKEPPETSNAHPIAEKALEEQSMGTVSTASLPKNENPIKDEKLLQVQGPFGVVKLLKVSKFWLISLNGQKFKVPKPAIQDPSIRFKVCDKDILLVTDSHCYIIKINEGKLTFGVLSSYFSKPPAEKYDDCTGRSQENDITGDSRMEKQTEDKKERENKTVSRFKENEIENTSFENLQPEIKKGETSNENKITGEKEIGQVKVNDDGSNNTSTLPIPAENNADPTPTSSSKYDQQKGTAVEKDHNHTNRQLQLFDRKQKTVHNQCQVEETKTTESSEAKKVILEQAEGDLNFGKIESSANSDDDLKEGSGRLRGQHFDISDDQEKSEKKSHSKDVTKNQSVGEGFEAENDDNQRHNDTYYQQNKGYIQQIHKTHEISHHNYQNQNTEMESVSNTRFKTHDTDDESIIEELTTRMNSTHITDKDEREPSLPINYPKNIQQRLSGEKKENEKPDRPEQNMQTIPLKGIYPDLEKEGASRFDRREDTSKGQQTNEEHESGNQSRIVSKEIELKGNFPWQRLLQKFDVLSRLGQMLKSLKVEILIKDQTFSIKFTGIERDTDYAVKYVQDEAANSVCKEQVMLNVQNMAVFQQTSFCAVLEQHLDGSVLVYEENKKLYVCSFDKETCKTAKLKICNLIREKTVSLTGKWRTEAGWKNLTDRITFDHKCIYISRSANFTSITVTGLKDKVEELTRDITYILQGKPTWKEENKDESAIRRINYCELKYFLVPGDLWLQLSERFKIEENLKQIAPYADVHFTKVEGENGDDCVLVITGREEQAEAAVQKFKRTYRDNILRKEIPLTSWTGKVIRNIDICSILSRKFPRVFFTMENSNLVCYTFDKHMASEISAQICRLITRENILLQGAWRKRELIKDLQDEIVETYEDVYLEPDYDGFSLLVAGIKEGVIKAANYLASKMKTDPQVSNKFKIKDGKNFQVLMKDAKFLHDIGKNLNVEIVPDVTQQVLDIRGFSNEVDKCTREIELYCKSVITESTEEVLRDSQYVASKGFQDLVDKVGEQNQVLIERSLRPKQETGIQFQDEERDRKCFLFPNGKKLILFYPFSAESGSDIIVKVSERNQHVAVYTRQYAKGQVIINMEHPLHFGRDAVQSTQEVIKKILTMAREDKEKVVEFQIPLLTWSIDDIMGCWIPAIYEYSMGSDAEQNPQYIILSPSSFNFQNAVGSCKIMIDKLVSESKSTNPTNQAKFKITVVPGKLDETKADVLVNTASSDLDLTRGAVSSALLQTAGPEIQSEVKRNHLAPLSPGNIVVTSGYKLRCKHVFHGALRNYNTINSAESRQQLHLFMNTCLCKANEYSAKSIAFPAIGAGKLRYPVQFVASEMFDAVKEFEKKCYTTSLEEVFFVIFPGDTVAVEAFEKRAEEEKKLAVAAAKRGGPSISQEQGICLNLRITGHKDNVAKALQRIRKDMFKKSQESSTDSRSKSYSDAVKTNSLRDSPEASSQASRPIGSPANTARAHEISGRYNWRQTTCTTAEGLIVKVYTSDILQLPVDCIVNAADEKLSHNAGLARNIAEAAGSGYVKECENYIKRYGPLPTGNAVKTGPGRLYFQLIIHAVGPEWYLYSPYTEGNVMACLDKLRKAIIASLKLAEESCMRTVVMPAISSGKFAVPKELCAMEYVKAVMEFSSTIVRGSRSLREIHFVDKDSDMTSLIEQAFTEMVIDKKKSLWDWRKYIQREQGVSVTRPKTEQQNQSTFSTFPQFLENGDTLTYKISQKRIMFISKGDIFSFNRADALVCSEDITGQAAGGVAKILLQKGGKQYETEKKEKYRERKPKTGDVVITRGGDSGFHWIIHAVMPHQQQMQKQSSHGDKEWKEALSNMIHKILQTAHEHRYHSLVMSLLGTGAGSSDPKQSAEVLLDCFTKSCTRHRDSPFDLYIINNDAGRDRIVKETFKKNINQAKQLLSGTAVAPMDISQALNKSFSTEGKTATDMKEQNKSDQSKCPICLDEMIKYPKHLECGHVFCEACINKSLKDKAVCPVCGKVLGVITGDQPDGDMIITKDFSNLPGFTCFTIKITYRFDSGKQGKNHPNPGKRFQGMTRSAYLPNNSEGRDLCAMLKLAFERRLVFTIGRSRTSGEEGVITWNDIHHKTNLKPNSEFGYPDPRYFQRLKQELAAKGVKEDDPKLDKSFLRKLDSIGTVSIPVKEHLSGNLFMSTTV